MSIRIIGGIVMCLPACLLLIAAYRSSPTIDEPGHLASGMINWKFGEYAPYCVNPPLIRKAAALPAMLISQEMNWPAHGEIGLRPEFVLGELLLQSNVDRIQLLFFLSRLPCIAIVLWGMWNCFAWAIEIAGNRAGLVALALVGFSPIILGHGALLSPDAAAAMLFAVSMRALYHFVTTPNLGAVLLWGILSGLAVSAKSSLLVLLPATVGSLLFVVLLFSRTPLLVAKQLGPQLALGSIAACLTICWTYDFDRLFVPLEKFAFTSESLTTTDIVLSSDGQKQLRQENRFEHSAIGKLPVPLPYYLVFGIDQQKTAMEGDSLPQSYFAGKWQERGWPLYYLVGTLLKEPFTFPILLVASIAAMRVRTGRNPVWTHGQELNLRLALTFLIVPATVCFLLVSAQLGFNRHLRYMLPAYPFVLMLISVLASLHLTTHVLRLLIGLQLISVLWHAPHMLSYFNELAGGPSRGKQWLESSNVDWGQDLHYLREWIETHPEQPLDYVALQSLYDVGLYGIDEKAPPPPFLEGIPSANDPNGLRGPAPGRYAVSAIVTVGREHRYGSMSATYLNEREPEHRVGYSVEIHEISVEEAVALKALLLKRERDSAEAKE
ncbi:ArnT family glycosyltransferase [Aureliella helgolandensis]|uniref:Uncharacterized protein n=1 Tax=Aureliella helgolandensis TaxID=2527968 RepID=A0A518G0E9_9BACT|nr:glycosyltransferase family 39 protein [Aureliella helgolandensis]QDV22079.1 hypothetical protein Q31a_03580 [Aureliella helgolandensis]